MGHSDTVINSTELPVVMPPWLLERAEDCEKKVKEEKDLKVMKEVKVSEEDSEKPQSEDLKKEEDIRKRLI